MKKSLPLLVVGIIVLSGFGTVAITYDMTHDSPTGGKSEVITMAISPLIIEKSDIDYIEVSFKDTTLYLMNPGQPMLPKVVKTVELPFGVQNVNVNVIPKNVQEYEINGEIRPAPVHFPLIAGKNNVVVKSGKDENVYASNELFPSTWYNYYVGCGLNAVGKRVTHVAIHPYPVRYAPALGSLYVAGGIDIEITYEGPGFNPFPTTCEYDLVVITPSKFASELKRLVDHKNKHGVITILETTEDIYNKYNGVDKPEQIKYFIKDAIETWGVKYVLLVGGLKSLIWARPRDDSNQGTRDWHIPVRYNNFFDHPEHPLGDETFQDPGVISDLYYADIYKEGGGFEDWDPNGDGIFAAWGRPDVENDTGLDFYPDVSLGRLACRNKREVKTVVDKIMKYEQKPADPSWFKKMIVISGDGHLDQEDLDIQWDVNSLLDGEYTIYAQSKNPNAIAGPIDIIHVTLDRSVESLISFNHDDHLKTDSYPFFPIAEITSPSEGNILGDTDFYYELSEGKAYGNEFTGWANLEYIDGIMHIRGKSYDPRPYGNVTDIHVWIENKGGEIVFSEWRNSTEMYYEGEWITGERLLQGRGGALYYMPEDFEKIKIWTSNGELTGQGDVIKALNSGCGFAFFSGHGNPNLWSDHYPGVPGNRGHSQVVGLSNVNVYYGPPPFLPMSRLSNIDKLPVVAVGGCHNSQFNVTLLGTLLDRKNTKSMWTYGSPAPECFSWWLIRLPRRGAIAVLGNTGLGYGVSGKDCTIEGLDGGICIEFFRQYSEEDHHILGEAYSQTLTSYINTYDIENLDHAKTLQQWILLGDPSLMIGGYS